METFGEELLDDMLNVTAEIRYSNRRLSARLDEALNSSVILRPSVSDGSLNNKAHSGEWGGVGEKEKEPEEERTRTNKRKAKTQSQSPPNPTRCLRWKKKWTSY